MSLKGSTHLPGSLRSRVARTFLSLNRGKMTKKKRVGKEEEVIARVTKRWGKIPGKIAIMTTALADTPGAATTAATATTATAAAPEAASSSFPRTAHQGKRAAATMTTTTIHSNQKMLHSSLTAAKAGAKGPAEGAAEGAEATQCAFGHARKNNCAKGKIFFRKELPYVCAPCDYATSVKSNLTRHFKSAAHKAVLAPPWTAKACSHCKIIKPRSEYHANKTKGKDMASACKVCANARRGRTNKRKDTTMAKTTSKRHRYHGVYSNEGDKMGGAHVYVPAAGPSSTSERARYVEKHPPSAASGPSAPSEEAKKSKSAPSNTKSGRKCTQCKIMKPRSEYHANRTKGKGMASACKVCSNAGARRRRAVAAAAAAAAAARARPRRVKTPASLFASIKQFSSAEEFGFLGT